MSINPQPGEVYFVDLGMAEKPRNILLVSVRDAKAPLAVVSGVCFTSHFHGSPYGVKLPKLPWMREQSHVNAQSLGGYRFLELKRFVGKLEPSVMKEVHQAIRLWLGL